LGSLKTDKSSENYWIPAGFLMTLQDENQTFYQQIIERLYHTWMLENKRKQLWYIVPHFLMFDGLWFTSLLSYLGR
jgi:hypothetical protein